MSDITVTTHDGSDNAEQESIHFTYKLKAGKDLEQGDILEKNEEIKKVLEKVHPHYLKKDYSHLMVVSQSCDLVIRNENKCNTPYITLVAVRPIETALERMLLKHQKSELCRKGNICSTRHKGKIAEFILSLLNNNNKEYFYLHEEPFFGFLNNSCAFLKLPISIRAADHYDKCKQARVITLRDEFKAKLGYLLGDIYARIATRDWDKPNAGKVKDNYMGSICDWVDDAKLKYIENDVPPPTDILEAGEDAIRDYIKKIRMIADKKKISEWIVGKLSGLGIVLDDAQEEKIKRRIENDSFLDRYINSR